MLLCKYATNIRRCCVTNANRLCLDVCAGSFSKRRPFRETSARISEIQDRSGTVLSQNILESSARRGINLLNRYSVLVNYTLVKGDKKSEVELFVERPTEVRCRHFL